MYIIATVVADMPDHGEVVGDQQIGEAELALQPGQQVQDPPWTETSSPAVGSSAITSRGERATARRHADPPRLAAAELVRVAAREALRQPDEVQQPPRLARPVDAPHAMDGERLGDQGADPRRGLKLATGSWNTSRPRAGTRAGDCVPRARSAPPSAPCRRGGYQPGTARPNVLLPEPLSPTSAKVGPGEIKETSRTASTKGSACARSSPGWPLRGSGPADCRRPAGPRRAGGGRRDPPVLSGGSGVGKSCGAPRHLMARSPGHAVTEALPPAPPRSGSAPGAWSRAGANPACSRRAAVRRARAARREDAAGGDLQQVRHIAAMVGSSRRISSMRAGSHSSSAWV